MSSFRRRRRVIAARRALARLQRSIDRRWPLHPEATLDALIDQELSGPPPPITGWVPAPDYVQRDRRAIARLVLWRATARRR